MPIVLTIKKQKSGASKIRWDRFNLDFSKKTYVMGILNRTPDSFSDGGKFAREEDAVKHALAMVRNGADIIDIGGESTRPGSSPVSTEEELQRVMPIIERLRAMIDVPISIDTSKARVAEAALKNGASMVNDITGLKSDRDMARVVAEYGVPLVVMHMKGAPSTMQQDPHYEDLIEEIKRSLRESIEIAKEFGIDENKIIIDPGIGFGKTLKHNLQIIKELYRFRALDRPIMIGVSRKSFIGKLLDCDVNERVMGTASCLALAIANGANIIRVHDVKEMIEVAQVADSICRA